MSPMAASPQPFTTADLYAAADAITKANERTLIIVCQPDRAEAIAAALAGRPGNVTVKTSTLVPEGVAYIIDTTPQILDPAYTRIHTTPASELIDPVGPAPDRLGPLTFLLDLFDG